MITQKAQRWFEQAALTGETADPQVRRGAKVGKKPSTSSFDGNAVAVVRHRAKLAVFSFSIIQYW